MALDSITSSLNKFMLSLLNCMIVGMAVFVGLHIFFVISWERVFALSTGTEAWWLDTLGSTAVTLVTLSLATVGVLFLSSVSNLAKAAQALALWVGILIGMFLSELTLQSEPNLGPIPFILGAVLTIPTVVLGWLAAIGLTKLVHHVRQRPQPLDDSTIEHFPKR
jgi:hypothetical protein